MASKLELAIAEINKRFGKGSIMELNNHAAAEAMDVIPTGNKKIDDLTGIGGFPRGRIVEIFGPEAGGKTTLALQVIAQAQKLGGGVVYIDAEHALDVSYAQALGVDTSKMLISQPESGEDGLEIALTMIQSKEIMVVVVDSVAALVPRHELEGDMGDAQMGLQARMMGQAMRKMTKAVSDSNCCLIFINQVREKLGVMFGNPETTSGGRALKFYASLRLDLRRIAQKKKGDVVIGAETKIKSIKNKMASPYRDVTILLTYGKGFIE